MDTRWILTGGTWSRAAQLSLRWSFDFLREEQKSSGSREGCEDDQYGVFERRIFRRGWLDGRCCGFGSCHYPVDLWNPMAKQQRTPRGTLDLVCVLLWVGGQNVGEKLGDLVPHVECLPLPAAG